MEAEGGKIMTEKTYETAKDMYDAMIGCGCCADDYISFEELKSRIIIEELMNRGHE